MPNQDDFQPLDLSDYEIHSRREIIHILRSLVQSGQLVQLRIAGGADAVLTSILEVDDSQDLVILDCAPEAGLNRRIVASDHLFFETRLDNIRILFEAGGAAPCEHDGGPALCIALPAALVRLQRREFYRVPTPIAQPVVCEIQIDAEGGKRVISLQLQNISAGGVALLDEQKLLNPTIGFIYPECRIQLPGGALISAGLEIRNLRDITLANGKSIRRVGCHFVDLPSGMLNAVQRYITSLEREQNAKNTGMR